LAFAPRTSRAAKYAPRNAARELEVRVIRASVFALVLLGAVMIMPSSVSRQSLAQRDADSIAALREPAGSTLSVVRDAIADPVRGSSSRPSGTAVVVPHPGTPTRSALLAAMRRETGVRGLFRVRHVAVSGGIAYMHTEALVRVRRELRGTGLEYAALFERDAGGRWHAIELWSRATDRERPYADFVRRVQVLARERALPPTLFPAEF
jgi:hypothetical protein